MKVHILGALGVIKELKEQKRAIKASHTFKRRASIGNFMDIVTRMVREWGEKDDTLLHGPRMMFLEKDPSGLKLKTEGE